MAAIRALTPAQLGGMGWPVVEVDGVTELWVNPLALNWTLETMRASLMPPDVIHDYQNQPRVGSPGRAAYAFQYVMPERATPAFVLQAMPHDGGVTTLATGINDLNLAAADGPELLEAIFTSAVIMPGSEIQLQEPPGGGRHRPDLIRQLRWASRAGQRHFFDYAFSPAGLPHVGRMYQKYRFLDRVHRPRNFGPPADMSVAAGGLPHATHWVAVLAARFGVVAWLDAWGKQ